MGYHSTRGVSYVHALSISQNSSKQLTAAAYHSTFSAKFRLLLQISLQLHAQFSRFLLKMIHSGNLYTVAKKRTDRLPSVSVYFGKQWILLPPLCDYYIYTDQRHR